MIKREGLNRLVVATLQVTDSLPAAVIFKEIASQDPKLFRIERVRSFKSFVKILNSFPEVQPQGRGVKTYCLK